MIARGGLPILARADSIASRVVSKLAGAPGSGCGAATIGSRGRSTVAGRLSSVARGFSKLPRAAGKLDGRAAIDRDRSGSAAGDSSKNEGAAGKDRAGFSSGPVAAGKDRDGISNDRGTAGKHRPDFSDD